MRPDHTGHRAAPSGLVPALLTLVAAAGLPALAQPATDDCPPADAPAQVEVLVTPFSDGRDTCDGFTNTVSQYSGGSCNVPGVDYSRADAVYKVRLHPGNQVAFHLDVFPPADFVLALIAQCRHGESCVSSSPDFIGSLDEDIPTASYPPGDYYLYVDTAADADVPCGLYALTVTGVNPTPDLSLTLTDEPDPVVAGEDLTYGLTAVNHGVLDATSVVLRLTLPAGVSVVAADGGCQVQGPTVACTVGALGIDATVERSISVRVDPRTRGTLVASAEAAAFEGDPTPSDNTATSTTSVIARSDLSVTQTVGVSPPPPVVAGATDLVYALQLHNAGPSDATQVKATDRLPRGVVTTSCPQGCSCQGGASPTVGCTFPRIAAGAGATREIRVHVGPSARDPAVNRVSVTAAEPDPAPADNSSALTIPVERRADLTIDKAGPPTAVAGTPFDYQLTVSNLGPSDSSGGTVTDDLPPGVAFRGSPDGCTAAGRRVTCNLDVLGAGAAATLAFSVAADPSPPPTVLINSATVTGADPEPDGAPGSNQSDPVETAVSVVADLRLADLAARSVEDFAVLTAVRAGERLVYVAEVVNDGPSTAVGGAVRAPTAAVLAFVASPDGCRPDVGGGGDVVCPLPDLRPGETATARWVVELTSSAGAGMLDEQVTVVGEDDPDPGNDVGSVSVAVEVAADVRPTLTGSPDPVVAGGILTYALTVTDSGPSDATGVAADVTLPPAAVVLPPLDDGCMDAGDPVVHCDLGDLPAGDEPAGRQIRVMVPQGSSEVTATVEVTAATTDPEPSNDEVTVSTTLAQPGEADVAVSKRAAVDAVVAGDLLHYTLEVVDNGPAAATGVVMVDPLPDGVELVTAGDGCSEADRVVTCTIGSLAVGAAEARTLTVSVDPDYTRTEIVNHAVVDAEQDDPDQGNDTGSAATPVLHLPPLVAPHFEASSDPAGVAALLSVRNPTAEPREVVLDFALSADEGTTPAPSRTATIAPKATLSLNVRDLLFPTPPAETAIASGWVGVTPVDGDGSPVRPEPPLSGDALRIDSVLGPASGGLLLATDTARLPPELCRRWDTRFVHRGPARATTEFVFFVPGGRTEGQAPPEAMGRVYDEAGTFVQVIRVVAGEESFTRSSAGGFDLPGSTETVPLLTSGGAVEWEFPEGIVGNVAAVVRAGNGLAVTLPGVCRPPPAVGDLPAEPPLVLPYFEVEHGNLEGTTTLLALRNGGAAEVAVRYEYLLTDGTLAFTEIRSLAGHATRTVNLRDVQALAEAASDGRVSGYVQISLAPADPPVSRHERILSGDYVRLTASPPGEPVGHRAAGGALVDTDPARTPAQLCHRWSTRLLGAEAAGAAGTEFLVFVPLVPEGDEPALRVQVFADDGQPAGEQTIALDAHALLIDAADLAPGVARSTVEWELLPEGLTGYVAAVVEASAGYSILVPGVCGD